MKKFIPWTVAVLLAAGVYFLFGSNRAKDADIARLSEENMEVQKLRQENEELRKLPDQQAEIERLRKDNEDVIRLRAEVSLLRGQAKQLNTQLAGAQAKGAQAVQAAQELAEKMALQAQPAPATAPDTNAAATADTAPPQPQEVCIANLRLIAAAKHQWALENSKAPDAVPTMADLSPYFVNKAALVCPNGGVYEINAIQSPPTCSIEGHTLTPQ